MVKYFEKGIAGFPTVINEESMRLRLFIKNEPHHDWRELRHINSAGLTAEQLDKKEWESFHMLVLEHCDKDLPKPQYLTDEEQFLKATTNR